MKQVTISVTQKHNDEKSKEYSDIRGCILACALKDVFPDFRQVGATVFRIGPEKTPYELPSSADLKAWESYYESFKPFSFVVSVDNDVRVN